MNKQVAKKSIAMSKNCPRLVVITAKLANIKHYYSWSDSNISFMIVRVCAFLVKRFSFKSIFCFSRHINNKKSCSLFFCYDDLISDVFLVAQTIDRTNVTWTFDMPSVASTNGCLFDWVCKRKWQQLWNCSVVYSMREEVDGGTRQSCNYTLIFCTDSCISMNWWAALSRWSVCVFLFSNSAFACDWIETLTCLCHTTNVSCQMRWTCCFASIHISNHNLIALRCTGISNAPWISPSVKQITRRQKTLEHA